MRKADRMSSWPDLRVSLQQAHAIMITVANMAEKAQVIADAILRGGRLLAAIGPGLGHSVLDIITDLLPRAHGVSKELFAAHVMP